MNNATYLNDFKVFNGRNDVSLKKTPFRNSFKAAIRLHLPFKSDRKNIENFIRAGFKNHYHANIQHFMPNLLSIGAATEITSALGFRSASTQTLFIEQYLNNDIEHYFSDQSITRDHIAEMGNLYGTSRPLTLQLFIITLLSLARSGFHKLVFCATPQVKTMFDRFAVPTQHIGTANPEKIGAQLQHWGSYYQTLPELFAIDIDEVISIIKQSKPLTKIAVKFSDEIDHLVNNLIK